MCKDTHISVALLIRRGNMSANKFEAAVPNRT